MSKLAEIQKEIYSLLSANFKNVYTEIPPEFDFKHNTAIKWNVGGTISDKWYRKDYDLEIHIAAVENRLLAIQETAEKIEGLLKRQTINDKYRIIENNPRPSFKDDDKQVIILQYLIIAY